MLTAEKEAANFIAHFAGKYDNPDMKSAYLQQVKELLVAADGLYGSLGAMKKELEQNLENRSYDYNRVNKWKAKIAIINDIQAYEKNNKINALDYVDAIPGTPPICEHL